MIIGSMKVVISDIHEIHLEISQFLIFEGCFEGSGNANRTNHSIISGAEIRNLQKSDNMYHFYPHASVNVFFFVSIRGRPWMWQLKKAM